jgi:hypothetical protein
VAASSFAGWALAALTDARLAAINTKEIPEAEVRFIDFTLAFSFERGLFSNGNAPHRYLSTFQLGGYAR